MPYRKFCTLVAALIICAPLLAVKATAEPPLTVVAAFVGPHPNGKECKSNLSEQTIDFTLPNNLKFDCGVTFILNKKIQGTAYLQLQSNNTWIDVSTIDTFGWHSDIKKGYVKKFPRPKMNNQISYNQGIIKNGSVKWVVNDKNLGNNGNTFFSPIYVWDNLTNFRYTEVGVNCHRTDITSFQIRVRVVTGGKEYISNNVVQNYINAEKYVTSTGYNFQCVVTNGATSSAGTTNKINPSASPSSTSIGTSTSACQLVASSGGSGYVKVTLEENGNGLKDYVLTNTLDCTFSLSVSARFICTGGKLPVMGTASIMIGPKQRVFLSASRYFPQADFECQSRLGLNNAYAYPINVSSGLGDSPVVVRIVGTR